MVEIRYCQVCNERVSDADLEQNHGVSCDGRVWCRKHAHLAPDSGRSDTPSQHAIRLKSGGLRKSRQALRLETSRANRVNPGRERAFRGTLVIICLALTVVLTIAVAWSFSPDRSVNDSVGQPGGANAESPAASRPRAGDASPDDDANRVSLPAAEHPKEKRSIGSERNASRPAAKTDARAEDFSFPFSNWDVWSGQLTVIARRRRDADPAMMMQWRLSDGSDYPGCVYSGAMPGDWTRYQNFVAVVWSDRAERFGVRVDEQPGGSAEGTKRYENMFDIQPGRNEIRVTLFSISRKIDIRNVKRLILYFGKSDQNRTMWFESVVLQARKPLDGEW